MTKIDSVIVEYEYCGECPYVEGEFGTGYRCGKGKGKRILEKMWGDIPDWCPLETKEVNND